MTITATELKANLSKHLLLAEKEDFYVSRKGKNSDRAWFPVSR